MNTTGVAVEGLADKVASSRQKILSELRKVIVGQDEVVDEVLMALFCGGHCLITGVPGTREDAAGEDAVADPAICRSSASSSRPI